jgi:hypothetical protein
MTSPATFGIGPIFEAIEFSPCHARAGARDRPPEVSEDERGRLTSDPFAFRTTKSGLIFIERGGKTVTTLRGKAAGQFLAKAAVADEDQLQHLLARATGHYKHGNER